MQKRRRSPSFWLLTAAVGVGLFTGKAPMLAAAPGAVTSPPAATADAPATPPSPVRVTEDAFRTSYHLPGELRPYDLVGDAHGNIWFGDVEKGLLGRLHPKNATVVTHTLPTGVSPLRIQRAENGALWLTDNSLMPPAGIRHILRFDPDSAKATLFPVPTADAGPFDLVIRDGRVWFTEWQGQQIGVLDPNADPAFREFPVFGGEERKGPLGLAFDRAGQLWYVDTYNSRFVRFDPRTGKQQGFAPPFRFEAPVDLAIDPTGRLWTGAHGGDRLLAFDPDTQQFETFVTPSPPPEVYPISGVNDVEFDSRGDVWFTEHFNQRLGRLHQDSKTVLEYDLPREKPLTQWMFLDPADQVWIAEYGTSVITRVDAPNLPLVTVSLPESSVSLAPGRAVETELTAQYVAGPADSVRIQAYGQGNWQVNITPLGDAVEVPRGQTGRFRVRLELKSNNEVTEASTHLRSVGVQGADFTATQAVTIQVAANGPGQWSGALVPLILLAAAGIVALAYFRLRRRAR